MIAGFALALGFATGPWMRSAPKNHELVYVSFLGVVDVYDATARDQYPIGQLVGPGGAALGALYVDAHENLFVASDTDIWGYHRGDLEPFEHLTDTLPVIALCGTGAGTLFATDGPRFGPPADTIEVYPPRHHKPAQTLYDYNALSIGQCTADSSGDVFVGYENFADAIAVDEFPSGSVTPVTLQTFSQSYYGIPALDAERNLVLASAYQSPVFQVYAPPYTGSPVRSFGSGSGSLAFDGTGKHVWSLGTQNAVEFDYASGKPIWYTAELNGNSNLQLAVSPQLTP
jgi:hypothetical protein